MKAFTGEMPNNTDYTGATYIERKV